MRLVQVSHLRCGKCGAEFDYSWVPFFSISSVRLAKWRYARCPNCAKWSVFNIISTRIDPRTHHCQLGTGPS